MGTIASFTSLGYFKSLKLGSLLSTTILIVSLLNPSQSHAIVFELNDTGGAGSGTNARSGFETAANVWSSFLVDDFTVRLDIGFTGLDAGILGSSSSSFIASSYTDVVNSLSNDATSIFDNIAVSNLQLGPSLTAVTNLVGAGFVDATQRVLDNDMSNNNRFLGITRANAKAIGFADTGATDAAITFSNAFSFDFDQSDGIAFDSIDFIGVAFHEIGHALGFSSGVDLYDVFASPNGPGAGMLGTNDLNNFAVSNILDLYRYQDGILDWSVGGNPYFSIDGGITDLGTFSSGRFNGDGQQASHWEDNLGLGIMDPTLGFGELGLFSPLDLLAFDAIGYDILPPSEVPVPAAIWLMGSGLIGLLGFSGKNKVQGVAA